MTKRVVVACFGDEASTRAIQHVARTADVIAVAFDFGGAVSLSAMHEAAIAAGAGRCHALDVREEFALESLIPALHRRDAGNAAVLDTLARAFVVRKLQEIAQLEGAAVRMPDGVILAPRRLGSAPAGPCRLHVAFANGIPVSVNGVEMTLPELMESVETITGEPALHVLDRELARSREEQPA